MKPVHFHHKGRFYTLKHASIEYYDENNNLVFRKERSVTQDYRFLFFGLELNPDFLTIPYFTYKEEFEIIIFEEFIPFLYKGYWIYVPVKTRSPLPQETLDREIIKKLAVTPNEKIPKFLSYQLKKYEEDSKTHIITTLLDVPDKKTVLKNWQNLLQDNSITEQFELFEQKKAIALDWIRKRIRKKNLRVTYPLFTLSFPDFFRSKDLFLNVMDALTKKGYVTYNPMRGLYLWRDKIFSPKNKRKEGREEKKVGGEDLAVLGHFLNKNKFFFKFFPSPEIHSAITKFFGVAGLCGYGERTFRESTIEEIRPYKRDQYKFLLNLIK